jgi:hypothetical protein
MFLSRGFFKKERGAHDMMKSAIFGSAGWDVFECEMCFWQMASAEEKTCGRELGVFQRKKERKKDKTFSSVDGKKKGE